MVREREGEKFLSHHFTNSHFDLKSRPRQMQKSHFGFQNYFLANLQYDFFSFHSAFRIRHSAIEMSQSHRTDQVYSYLLPSTNRI